MLLSGWFWLISAIVLAIAETILPGFILLGFSLGALVTGLVLFTGLVISLPWVLLLFAIASGIGWLVLRKIFMRPEQRPKIWRRDINDN